MDGGAGLGGGGEGGKRVGTEIGKKSLKNKKIELKECKICSKRFTLTIPSTVFIIYQVERYICIHYFYQNFYLKLHDSDFHNFRTTCFMDKNQTRNQDTSRSLLKNTVLCHLSLLNFTLQCVERHILHKTKVPFAFLKYFPIFKIKMLKKQFNFHMLIGHHVISWNSATKACRRRM